MDDEYISQREIEKDLIEKFDKGSDRSLSLLKFIFTIASFYIVSIVYVYDELDINLILSSASHTTESTYSIRFCFITLFLAFSFSFKPLTVVRYKFIETKNSIKYREGHELEKNNRRIAINIRKQNFYNMLSTYFITSSFLFFLGYFFGQSWFLGAAGFTAATISSFITSFFEIYNIEINGREVLDIDEKYRDDYDSDKGIITTIVEKFKEIRTKNNKN